MFSGEGDFCKSLERVHDQTDVTITHFIVAGLNELEAHNALWSAWRENQSSHDLFVKVDADTVLRSSTTLAEIWAEFAQNPRITGIQAPLHDYMTDSLINGLNCFSKHVVFNQSKDDLFCDRNIDTGHDIVLRQDDLPDSLKPAGFHCHLSNERQAFHYGLHRALKNQDATIAKVRAAFMSDFDLIRGFALIGAKMAYRFAKHRRFNYTDEEFKAAFVEATQRYDALTKEV